MAFQAGQLVQCKAAAHDGHRKLIGCIGEIKTVFDPIMQIMFMAEYAVFFPNYPSGQCPYCDKDHDPLYFLMFGIELKNIDDPDAGKQTEEDKNLPLEFKGVQLIPVE